MDFRGTGPKFPTFENVKPHIILVFRLYAFCHSLLCDALETPSLPNDPNLHEIIEIISKYTGTVLMPYSIGLIMHS